MDPDIDTILEVLRGFTIHRRRAKKAYREGSAFFVVIEWGEWETELKTPLPSGIPRPLKRVYEARLPKRKTTLTKRSRIQATKIFGQFLSEQGWYSPERFGWELLEDHGYITFKLSMKTRENNQDV